MQDLYLQGDLITISGRHTRADLAKWLADNSVPFIVNAAGWPVVAKAALLHRLGVPHEGQAPVVVSGALPNFASPPYSTC